MNHLGDITKIHGDNIPPVNCIIGGSPCQDLSVAGKRAGLSGARSGLFMEQIRIVKEMRENDRSSGRANEFVRPRYMVWENVPGAFSSNKGEDFRAVLEETARIADGNAVIPQPPKGKWANAGCIMGNGWSIAWRVHDAQFWGVPQRRRRISLVADFGGQSAAEILFERKGVSGDSAESGVAGQGTAGVAENGIDSAVCVRMREGCDGGGKGPLIQTEKSGTLGTSNGQTAFAFSGGQGAECYGICSFASNSMKSTNPHSGIYVAETSRTLDLNGGNPACNQGGICIVAQCYDMTHATDVIRECGETAPTLQSRMGTGGNQIPLTFSMQGFGDYKAGEIASSCKKRDYKDSTDLIASVDCRNGAESEVNGTLQAKPSGGQSLNLNNVVRTGYAVRRLTPLECERLQGYPDRWTDIPGASDSARYKALGNSIALPFWRWMLTRMSTYLPADATLGSLFDGIGGFPLIWEEIHGKGSARWASEIEKFPIAVTKYHFGRAYE